MVKKEVSKIKQLSKVADIKFLKFGIEELDDISGLPIGHLTTIHGEAHVGKTDLALRIAVNATKEGKKVLFWDVENRLNPKRFEALGGDRQLLWHADGYIQEEVAEEVIQLVDDYELIIIDSIAALLPRAVRDSEMGDANIGVQAKMNWKWIRILQGKLAATNCTVIFISQIKQSPSIFKPTYIAGGDGILYSSSLILRLSANNSSDNIKDKNGEYIGRKVHALITKSNLGELRDGKPWNYHKQEAVFKLLF